jgi:hypothetical protein
MSIKNGHGKGTGNQRIDEGYVGEEVGVVSDWLAIWDYVGGNKFRGFVAEKDGERSMFVFFDNGVMGSDLKPGYVVDPRHERTTS